MGGGNKILVIENEESLANFLETKLKKEGFEILTARDGEVGYAQIKSWKPDLVLLDIPVSNMNEYLEKIYKEGVRIPFIIISNSDKFAELEKIKKIGAVDFLVKSEFGTQEIIRKIEKYLKRNENKNSTKGGSENSKILLVEDEQLLREICSKKLLIEGYDVIEVLDGGDALKKITQEKPDLILLDIILPTINGFEILKQIRSNEDTKIAHTPVIILSNLGQETDIARAKELGISGYLIKAQFTTDEIIEKVEKVLKEKK